MPTRTRPCRPGGPAPISDGAWCRCRVMSIFLWDPPVPEAALVTSPARFGDADPDPAVPTRGPGTDLRRRLVPVPGDEHLLVGPARSRSRARDQPGPVRRCRPGPGRADLGARHRSPTAPGAGAG